MRKEDVSCTRLSPHVESEHQGVASRGVQHWRSLSAIALGTSVLRGLRKKLAEITGAFDAVEAGPRLEAECPAERCAAIWATKHDESSDVPLDPEVVADTVKKELALVRPL